MLLTVQPYIIKKDIVIIAPESRFIPFPARIRKEQLNM